MATQKTTTEWRAWAAFHIGILMGKIDPRTGPELWEAVSGGMLDSTDDEQYQRVLGQAIRSIVDVPIVQKGDLPDGQENTE